MIEMATRKPPWGATDLSNHLALIFKVRILWDNNRDLAEHYFAGKCEPNFPQYLMSDRKMQFRFDVKGASILIWAHLNPYVL